MNAASGVCPKAAARAERFGSRDLGRRAAYLLRDQAEAQCRFGLPWLRAWPQTMENASLAR
jgi:hypothetical protein